MPSSNPDLTTHFDWPTPKPSDPPDVPGDMKALADQIDADLARFGAHGTWRRQTTAGQHQTINSDGYLSFAGANMSDHPPGSWSGDDQGLIIPFYGVFLLQAQIKWESASGFDRAQIELRQGAASSTATAATVQVKHLSGGSEQITMAGRASIMDPGDRVRLYVEFLAGTQMVVSQLSVHAAYIGLGK